LIVAVKAQLFHRPKTKREKLQNKKISNQKKKTNNPRKQANQENRRLLLMGVGQVMREKECQQLTRGKGRSLPEQGGKNQAEKRNRIQHVAENQTGG
jgi:hypothetical protein